MKKKMIFALLASGLAASFFVGNSMSQDATSRRKNRTATTDEFTPEEFQTQSLQKQIVELTQKRFKTMKKDELIAEIARLQKRLAEHKAEEKLQQSQKLLQEIVKDHPESKAAKRARRMLEGPDIRRSGGRLDLDRDRTQYIWDARDWPPDQIPHPQYDTLIRIIHSGDGDEERNRLHKIDR